MQNAQQLLQDLIGLPLSIARNVCGMKVFHFGRIRPHHSAKGTVGDRALHVQCSWRIVGPDGLITAEADATIDPDGNRYMEPEDVTDRKTGTLQSVRLLALLGSFDDQTNSHVNLTDRLLVEKVVVDAVGGLDINLSGAIRLQLFTDSSFEENWRFFAPQSDTHLVCIGGRVVAE